MTDVRSVTPYDPKIHGEIPKRYIDCTKGDIEESEKRWVATVEWRESFGGGLDHLLENPPEKFEAIKACYPQYVHGIAKTGNYVYIERPGLADFKVLMEVMTVFDVLNVVLGGDAMLKMLVSTKCALCRLNLASLADFELARPNFLSLFAVGVDKHK